MTRSSRASPKTISPAPNALDPFQAQHARLRQGMAELDSGRCAVAINDGESPLAWLARRKGRDGVALIAPHQLQAGERLRADFTRAALMPRTTSNWDISASRGRGGGAGMNMTEGSVAARQRVRLALEAAGPEFAGLLLDVCCFLKGIEDVERERIWPRSSAKIVLRLGLDRLARHYGYAAQAVGRVRADIRVWLAEDAVFTTEVG
jgi:hypothetical protein